MDSMKDGILEEWIEVGEVVYGTIYYDSKGRFEDGTEIKTSKVMGCSTGCANLKQGSIIVTYNSTYVLGMKAGDEIDD